MTQPIGRRALLGGAGVVALGAAGGWWWVARESSDPAAVTGAALVEPPVHTSTGGLLDVRLVASEEVRALAGSDVRCLGYGASVPGPTLRVAPGDTLRVLLVNDLDEPTNLHVHGLQVSPTGASDDVFVSVAPGQQHQYVYEIGEDHPTGTFWYHAHHHGSVADQVWRGLFGALLVLDPAASARTERVLVVSDVTLAGGAVAGVTRHDRMAGREGALVLVDGQSAPEVVGAPGTVERWRVVNACTSRYLRPLLSTVGAAAVAGAGVVARDGRDLASGLGVGEVVVPPGGRADLVVPVGQEDLVLTTAPVDRGAGTGGTAGGGTGGMMGGASDEQPSTLLTLRATGPGAPPSSSPATTAPPGPSGTTAPPRDLRDVEPDRRRTLTLTSGMGQGMGGGMLFGIDGRTFQAGRTDHTVTLGTVEEWTLVNDTTMDHPFHLHVWPMQVLDGGEAPLLLDTVDVPAGHRVVVRVAFDAFPGRTVYHCHVLDHEDLGMMGTLEALRP
ncbi:multicopper oxidase domain-containing protein [Nocardioides bruguierae]|uniref:Multicopper oxidase family protein n=1 Tax=Nocardioides bruguierae TaxID=2945102 RepID=A0A9X2D4W0_9ACTN|nr:multicopper oxidase family protein [Nocardioides bruguierae]MCM0619263.1 multicopper oxidase family protein [Nocardioides bruguierae]